MQIPKNNSVEIKKHTIILNNLFYALCGLDTTYLKIGLDQRNYVLVVESEYPFELLKPFESLCINVRITNKFILKSQYSTDLIRKTLSEALELLFVSYMKKVSQSRKFVKAIEELYVLLEGEILMFEEIKSLVDVVKHLNGIMIFNTIEARRKQSVRYSEFYDGIIKRVTPQIEEEVFNWVTRGVIPHSNFMIRKNVGKLQFEECFWISLYVKNETQIPFYLESQFDLILKCGKYTNLIKELQTGNLKNEINLKNEKILINEGLVGLSKYLEESAFLYIKEGLRNEIEVIGKYILMKDASFYSDLFAEMDEKLLFNNTKNANNDNTNNANNDNNININNNINSKNILKNILKINTLKRTSMIEFYASEDTINAWISKIFNIERSDANKEPLPIIQSLSIRFRPAILKYFVDEKSLRELELIFRFLFTLSSIQHFLQKHLKFRFSKIVLCLINTFRFTVLYETDDLEINQDIDLFIYKIDLIIKQYLNNLFLTSSNIFEIFIELFTICLDFIKVEYKDRLREDEIENYDKKLGDILKKLLQLCRNINCDYIFLNCLENLTKENVYKLNNNN